MSWALSYKILPPEITKMWEMSILGGGEGTLEPMWAWEPMWNPLAFSDFVNF